MRKMEHETRAASSLHPEGAHIERRRRQSWKMFRDAECWINKEGGKVAELADRKRAVEMDRQILSLSFPLSLSLSGGTLDRTLAS